MLENGVRRMKKILLIYNPKAGKNSRRPSAERLASLLSAEGNEVDVYVTTCRGDATEKARTAQVYDVLAVAGGDGTLNEVLNGAIEAGYAPTVLYIPSGTTNQTAMAFGLPTKAENAAHLLQDGEIKKFDLGKFNDRAYIDVCSFGYGTESSLTTSQKLKNKLGFKAFYINQIRYLFSIKPIKMRITCDGRTIEGEYVFGNLVNTNMISTFVRLNDVGVEMDDGYLDLVVVKKLKNFLFLPGAFIKLLRKKFDGEKIIIMHGKLFTLEFEGERSFLLDGERLQADTVAHVRVLPDAFSMYVPKQ